MFIDPRLSRRRVMVLGGSTLALAGCGTSPTAVITAASGAIAGVDQVIADGGDILSKVDTIRQALTSDAQSLLDKGKALLTSLTASKSTGDGQSLVSTLAGLATLLPPPYGTIALAVKTLVPIMGNALGLRLAATPTGLTEAQARAIIRAR